MTIISYSILSVLPTLHSSPETKDGGSGGEEDKLLSRTLTPMSLEKWEQLYFPSGDLQTDSCHFSNPRPSGESSHIFYGKIFPENIHPRCFLCGETCLSLSAWGGVHQSLYPVGVALRSGSQQRILVGTAYAHCISSVVHTHILPIQHVPNAGGR